MLKHAAGTNVYFISPEFAGIARSAWKVSAIALEELKVVQVNGRNSPPTGIEGIWFALQVGVGADLRTLVETK